MSGLELSDVWGVALDETASRRGHRYVTIFPDMDKGQLPVIFTVHGKGKECLKTFAEYLK